MGRAPTIHRRRRDEARRILGLHAHGRRGFSHDRRLVSEVVRLNCRALRDRRHVATAGPVLGPVDGGVQAMSFREKLEALQLTAVYPEGMSETEELLITEATRL